MTNIKKYVDYTVSKMNIPRNEKIDLKIEFEQHICQLKYEYLQNGYDEQNAIKAAIKDFGENMDTMDKKNVNKIKIALFIAYCLFLIVILFNNRQISYLMEMRSLRGVLNNVNFIPFNTIFHYLTSFGSINTSIIIENLLYKTFLFVPWGFLFPKEIFNKYNQFRNFFIVALTVTFSLQMIRIVLPVGIADIDNIILYTSGACLGYLSYNIFIKFAK